MLILFNYTLGYEQKTLKLSNINLFLFPDQYQEELCQRLSSELPASVWQVQLEILKTLVKIIKR